MLKESIVLVASTGLLIFFITPSEEPPKAEPVEAEVQEVIRPVTQTSDDSWENDENEEAGDENFVFGEPMIVAGSGSDEQSGDEDNSVSSQYQSDNEGSKSGSFSSSRNERSAGNPRPGDPGSIQNPIELNRNKGPAPTSSDDR